MKGSSPLARGLRLRRCRRASSTRIIPARAGFTTDISSTTTSRSDHPRSRGVYAHILVRHLTYSGSSPLARGLLIFLLTGEHAYRIIPARAGFTQCSIMKVRTYTDHPRSRGVYFEIDMLHARHPGSSPLARGLRLPGDPRQGSLRIIPARAGFTSSWPQRWP